MSTTNSTHDPGHWRMRADEARRSAAEATDPKVKSALLEIARSYEQVADLIATTK